MPRCPLSFRQQGQPYGRPTKGPATPGSGGLQEGEAVETERQVKLGKQRL